MFALGSCSQYTMLLRCHPHTNRLLQRLRVLLFDWHAFIVTTVLTKCMQIVAGLSQRLTQPTDHPGLVLHLVGVFFPLAHAVAAALHSEHLTPVAGLL